MIDRHSIYIYICGPISIYRYHRKICYQKKKKKDIIEKFM